MIILKVLVSLGIGKRVIRVGRIVTLGRHINMSRVGRTETVSLTLTSAQKERWKLWADKKNMSLAEFIRNGIEIYIAMLEKLAKKA